MKKILSLIIVAMLSLSAVTFIARAAPPIMGPCMYAEPATHAENFYPSWPGTNPKWNFSIMVSNLTNVLTLAFSAVSLNTSAAIITNYYDGPGFTALGLSETIGYWNATNGEIIDLTGYKTSKFNVTTPLCIWYVEVEGLDFTYPTVVIDVYAQYAAGALTVLSGDCPYDHTVTLTNEAPPPPPPTPPTANFTWTPATVYDGDTVNFDASASTGGYDGTSNTTITEYRWDWTNDGTFDYNNSGPTASHAYSPDGTYYVKLQVYAPNATNTYNATYDGMNTDDLVRELLVYIKSTGRDIDLYTDDWRYPGYSTIYTGEKPTYVNGDQVDSYSPQDLICLYAKLTYNGEPICYKEVAFEIHGPDNSYQNITIYRQTFTNGSGIAEICFRIPWPDVHAEQIVFGPWSALAKASVANEIVFDSHWWWVHWIVEIISETVSPNPVYEKGTLTVNVTVKNWAMLPRNFTYTATLYDELQVPVGSAVLEVVNAPSGVSGPYSVQIYVPEWAYVGSGAIVYKDLFTKLPWLCGFCWSPEGHEHVTIKATDPHEPPF